MRLPSCFQRHLPLVAGIVAGAIGLVVSFWGRRLELGRPLGDPLPLILSVNQLTNGFLYFNWRAPLAHLLFLVFLAGLATAVVNYLAPTKGFDREGAAFTARSATITVVTVQSVLTVDAPIVVIWTIGAGLLSMLLAGFFAARLADLWLRRSGSRD